MSLMYCFRISNKIVKIIFGFILFTFFGLSYVDWKLDNAKTFLRSLFGDDGNFSSFQSLMLFLLFFHVEQQTCWSMQMCV